MSENTVINDPIIESYDYPKEGIFREENTPKLFLEDCSFSDEDKEKFKNTFLYDFLTDEKLSKNIYNKNKYLWFRNNVWSGISTWNNMDKIERGRNETRGVI